MSVGRKCLGFLTVLALSLCGLFFCFQPSVLEWASVLYRGFGLQAYEAAAAGEDGVLCAAGWNGGALHLVFFNASGERLAQWDAPLPEEASGGTVAGLYPLGTEMAFCGVYAPETGELLVFSLPRGEEAECLLREDGNPFASRAARLFPFSQDEGEIRFVVQREGELTGYAWNRDISGVRILSKSETSGVRGAVMLSDGTMAASGDGVLSLNGVPTTLEGQRPSFLTRAGTGLYYVDAVSLGLYYSDLTGSAVRQTLSLDGDAAGHRLSSLAITGQGDALLLLDGRRLVLTRKTGSLDLTRALYDTPDTCVVRLVLCALLALLIADLVWYVLCCLLLKNRLPMLVQGGAVLLASALLTGIGMYWGFFVPLQRQQALERERAQAGSLVRLALEQTRPEEPLFDERMEAVLEAGGKKAPAVSAFQAGSRWLDRGGDRAELSPVFDGALVRQAASSGTAARLDGEVFRCALLEGDWAVCVSFELRTGMNARLWRGVLGSLIAMPAVGLLLLLSVSHNARKLAKAAENLTRGQNRRIRLRSGDELEGLAATLDGLAASAARQNQDREELARSYRRFVPERIISLLGKKSIREVDKSTFASRHMAVMMVRFQFPEPVYSDTNNSRLLFDSVNEITERTASIAAGQGGTVFNFAYNGYDVVMDGCPGMVSAAVAMAQEALSFNEARARRELPAVSFHVALDVGDVMLGIVGDEMQMEPATISTSFSTVRELIRLCGKLQAGILCTEAVISTVEDQMCRYMGKCGQDGAAMRVYEIFSGDSYDVRRGKENTVQRFSQGVLALYSGETARAKRIFLELAHQNSHDGGVRYYLYLSDRMEEDPKYTCGLDG